MGVVQELISRVKVVGAEAYVSALKGMDRATEGFSRTAAMAGRSVLSGIASPIGQVMGLASVGGLVKVGSDFVRASADAEQFRVTMEVLGGSAEVAARKIAFIEKLDIVSPAGLTALRTAGQMVEAFGLNVERVLPLVATLNAVRPDKNVMEAAGLFGRLAQGDFPDMEAMSGFGLNKQQFMRQGIKFDGDGKLLSSAKDTLNALERIIGTKYGGILSRMASTTNSRLASLGSAWTRFSEQAGNVLAKALLPQVERLTKWLDTFQSESAFLRWMSQMGVATYDFTQRTLELASAWAIVAGVIAGALRQYMTAVKFLALGVGLNWMAGDMEANRGERLKNFNKWLHTDAKPGATAGGTVAGTGAWSPDDKNLELQKQIEANTRRAANAAEKIDFKRYALGGGDLGKIPQPNMRAPVTREQLARSSWRQQTRSPCGSRSNTTSTA
jgi:hypothetical protein